MARLLPLLRALPLFAVLALAAPAHAQFGLTSKGTVSADALTNDNFSQRTSAP